MYKADLKDFEICDHAINSSADPEDLDLEELEGYFKRANAKLINLKIRDLKLSNESSHLKSEKKQKMYNRLNLDESPPIIVNATDLEVIDGRHRIRAHLYQGCDSIWAYLISWD